MPTPVVNYAVFMASPGDWHVVFKLRGLIMKTVSTGHKTRNAAAQVAAQFNAK